MPLFYLCVNCRRSFGFKTLERSYLLRINNRVAERPQHMIMRVAVGIHGSDIDRVIETYNLMSERYFTHASPTLFNAGTPHPQLSSCFLVCMKEDSIEGIYDTLKNCAMISKTAGGIGLNIHCIRATGFVLVFSLLPQADRVAGPTSRGQTVTPTELCLCYGPTMPRLATLTKAEISARAHSQFISSPGMPTSLSSLTSGKTTARRKHVLAICFMRSGYRTSCLLIFFRLPSPADLN